MSGVDEPFVVFSAAQLDEACDEMASNMHHGGWLTRRALGDPVATLPITSAEYRKRSFARSRSDVPNLTAAQRRLALYGLGLSDEAGEVSGVIKKHLFHDMPLDREDLLAECGDVLWYLDRVLWAIGASLEDAMVANDAKLAARYPDGWDAADRHFGFTNEDDR
jgi:NTP pyrophosphatase (non-canonical NTP hydrolase)